MSLQSIPNDSENLTSKAAKGVAWTGMAQVADRFARLISTTILATLLEPSDFGLIGIVAAITALVNIFRNAGTGAAIVQRKQLSESVVHSVFCFNIVLGVIAAAVVCLSANTIANFFGEPVLKDVLKVSSLVFILSAAEIVPTALLSRRMQFDKLAKISCAHAILVCTLAVFLAVNGWGVWSLVLPGVICATIFPIIKMIVSGYVGKFKFEFAEFRSIFGFSGFLTAFSLVKYFSRNTDMLLVAKFLTLHAAGFYGLAYGLMLLPIQACVDVIKRVMFPAFAKIQSDDQRFRRGYLRALQMTSFLIFPAIVGLVVVVQDAILLVYGESWAPAIGIFVCLAPVGLVESLTSTTSVIYQSKSRTDLLFGWSVVSTLVTIPSLCFGLQFGVTGVAIAYSLVSIALLAPSLWIPARLIGLPVSKIFLAVAPAFLCSLLMGIVTFAVVTFIPIDQHFLRLVTMIIVGVSSYAVVSWAINLRSCTDFINLVRASTKRPTKANRPDDLAIASHG